MELQKNHITGVTYEGQNQATLLAEKDNRGYKSNRWLTFLQAKAVGRSIKKGEHGVPIVKFVDYQEKVGDRVEDRKGRKVYTVFNFEQTELTGTPEYGKIYALTSDESTPSILNGNSWATSEIHQ